MCEIRRGTDGRNALPNIVDEEVGLGSLAETEGTPVAKVKRSYPNKYPKTGIPMLGVNMATKNIQCGSMIKIKKVMATNNTQWIYAAK